MSDFKSHNHYQLYRYEPSLAAAIVFIVLFACTTVYHSYQLATSRSWYFIPFTLGGVFQIIGYVARAVACSQTRNVPIYSIQTVFILLAPPLYAASIYMSLGRIVSHLRVEGLSIVPLKWMTGFFVAGDVVSFLTQAAGGAIMATRNLHTFKTGEDITMAGLGVQLVFFTFFVFTAINFHRRYRFLSRTTQDRTITRRNNILHITHSWETVLWGLYIASVLILIRSIFRLVEYSQGNGGYLISHEVFMYVFDGTLMLFAMLAMNVFHPSVILTPRTE
ncbi:hypothetical protein N7452_009780 [Penicillium brevicompactum]|uniref:RTA1 like protein n=1 Tax=Penicillium brevicompactum TaxID=5074 RepID=A0A9W9UCL9_PENBR|nr:hypothetical protein N7452_009780 [Penicillium brevicompactum]